MRAISPKGAQKTHHAAAAGQLLAVLIPLIIIVWSVAFSGTTGIRHLHGAVMWHFGSSGSAAD